ncbi:hypothetical protein [Actinokineospora enzanensis]|uniref:hypothetical protein n=1 Tax=Actinokineospora enzanensis TaxID=155975 RepID=UPI00036607FA|nr:hypothetical protein [Actinokineospora enzanensis]
MRNTLFRIGAGLGLIAAALGVTATSAAAESTDSIVPDLTINVINADSVNVASPLLDLVGDSPQ